MTTVIETNPKFRFRLEDYVYSSLVAHGFLISLFVYSILSQNAVNNEDKVLFMVIFNLFFLALATFLIYNSFRKRWKIKCIIEDDYLIKYYDGRMIFKIPLKEIVSIRINDRRGNEGSIVFFTNAQSKNYTFAYIPFIVPVPLALYGLTKYKINRVTDRKWLVTKLYEANPKLNFIENR
ncbi:hypothetical protein [Fluviicola taffensis]|uniref:hypothetical protein n=1 Tax=Fluviicola taffensis TaxID=191579 RepID=UPI003137F3FC